MKRTNLVCYYSLIGALLASPYAAYGAGIRVGNLSRSNAQGHQQVAEKRNQLEQQARAAEEAANAPLAVRVEDESLAEKIRSAHPDATVTREDLDRCAAIYPDGEFTWARPTAGATAGSAPQCAAVVEMQAYQAGPNGSNLVVARTILGAGQTIKCNISEFPESSWLDEAGQIEFPADNPPTEQDVIKAMNAEQKQNAGIKILAGALIGGVGGNVTGKNEVGKDGLLGAGRDKMKNTAIGAFGGAAIMAGNAFGGKVAGDMILSTGINAAAGAVMGNIVASGDSVMRIERCVIKEKETTCLWGIVETLGEAISEDKVAYVSGKDVTNFKVCNKKLDQNGNSVDSPENCSYGDLSNVTIAAYDGVTRPNGLNYTLADMKAENWQRVYTDAHCFDSKNNKMTKGYGSSCNDGPWYEIASASYVTERIPAMISGVQDKATGWKQSDWAEVVKKFELDRKTVYGRNGDGSSYEIVTGATDSKSSDNDAETSATTSSDTAATAAATKTLFESFRPVYRDADSGGIVDMSNKARLKGTLTGAGVGAGMGAFSAYQGAQDDIKMRLATEIRAYQDSLQKVYCVTGKRFLSQYNDMAFIPAPAEPAEQEQQ